MLTQPITSELTVAGDLWAARAIDADGQAPAFTRDPASDWARDMHLAAHVLYAADPQPRILIIVHPAGYGEA